MAKATWNAASQILTFGTETSTLDDIGAAIADTDHFKQFTSDKIKVTLIMARRFIFPTELTVWDITVPANEKLIIILDAEQAAGKEFDNSYGGLVKMTGASYTLDGNTYYMRNIEIIMPRVSEQSYNANQAGLRLNARTELTSVKLKSASPINARTTSRNGVQQYTKLIGCLILPFDRVGSETGQESLIEMTATNILDVTDTEFSVILQLQESIPITENFASVRAISKSPYVTLKGLTRTGTSNIYHFTGLKFPSGAVILAGSGNGALHDTSQGTSFQFQMWFVNDFRIGGIVVDQRVQFISQDLNKQPLEHARISFIEHNDGKRPLALYIVDTWNNATKTATWIPRLTDLNSDKRYTTVSGADGKGAVIVQTTGYVHCNDPGRINYNDNLPDTVGNVPYVSRLTIGEDGSHIGYGRCYGSQAARIEYVARADNDIVSVPVTYLPDLNITKTRAQVLALQEIATYSDLYDAMKMLESIDDDVFFIDGYATESIIGADKTITLRDGHNLELIKGINPNPIQYDAITQTFRIFCGAAGILASDNNFQKLIVQGNIVNNDNITLQGLYQYTKPDGTVRKSYQIKPLSEIGQTTKFSIDVLQNNEDGTQTILYRFHDEIGNLDQYIELNDGIRMTIHVFGTGIVEVTEIYNDGIPDLINPDLTIDTTQADLDAWNTKIDNGDWDATIANDKNSIALGGTETLANVNSRVLRFLVNHAITKWNQLHPLDRLDTADFIIDTGDHITIKKYVSDFNFLYMLGPASRMTMADANVAALDIDFGIAILDTTTKYAWRLDNVKDDDVLSVEINGVDAAPVLIQNTTLIHTANKADTIAVCVKRSRHTSLYKELTANDPAYTPVFILIIGADAENIANTHEPISDYIEAHEGAIRIKKSTVELNTLTAEADQKDRALYYAFDLTFPFGTRGQHIIQYIENNLIVMNYNITVPLISTEDQKQGYLDDAGVRTGYESNGDPIYSAFKITYIGGNHETFTLHSDRTRDATHGYNDAGKEFYNLFHAGHELITLIFNHNGQRHTYEVVPNGQRGLDFYFDAGLPEHIGIGTTVTFKDPDIPEIINNKTPQFSMSIPIYYIVDGELTRAPAYITFAHHDTVTVDTPAYVNKAISDTAGHLGIIEPIVKELPEKINDNKQLLRADRVISHEDGKGNIRYMEEGTDNVIMRKTGKTDAANKSDDWSGGDEAA